MTEKEVRAALKQRRWSFLFRKRKSRQYIYAARKVQNKRIECYICPSADLPTLSRSSLLVKLDSIVPFTPGQANESETVPGQEITLVG